MIFLIPVAAVAGLAVFAWRKHKASSGPVTSPSQISAGHGTLLGASSLDSPLAALEAFMQSGQQPPPIVIQCALAEAQSLGRADVVEVIVRAYIEPTVRAATSGRPSDAPSPSPGDDGAAAPDPGTPGAASPLPEGVDVAPEGFDPATATAADIDRLVDAAVPVVAQAVADELAQAGPVTVSGAAVAMAPAPRSSSSPIPGIDGESWGEFVARLSREAPTFATERHVGQFRHRRDRIAELGMNPARIASSPEAQVAALTADMADAFRHAKEGGLVDEYVSVAVKIDGKEHGVTLSGLLGVIQAAGLDAAAEWLERPDDRRRFPHTTKMFLQTNGVF